MHLGQVLVLSFIAAYERELIGLVQAVLHWCPYLWGKKFLIRTDHYSLKFMLDQRLSTIPQHQWVSKLFGFDFTIEYRPGRLNIVVDSLSRRAQPEMELSVMSRPSFNLFAELRDELDTNPEMRELRESISTTRGSDWTVQDGLITCGSRVFIPASSTRLETVLHMAHTTGHEGT
jgi:hypothetical protein